MCASPLQTSAINMLVGLMEPSSGMLRYVMSCYVMCLDPSSTLPCLSWQGPVNTPAAARCQSAVLLVLCAWNPRAFSIAVLLSTEPLQCPEQGVDQPLHVPNEPSASAILQPAVSFVFVNVLHTASNLCSTCCIEQPPCALLLMRTLSTEYHDNSLPSALYLGAWLPCLPTRLI